MENTAHPTARAWATALFVLLVSQFVFWPVVGLTERAARPAGMAMQPDVHYVLYNKAGEPISGGWELKADRDRHRGYVAPGSAEADHAVFSLLFTVPDKTRPLALLLENREYIDAISLNGLPIQPDKPLRRLRGDVSAETGLYPLAGRYLQNGTNVLYVKISAVKARVALSAFAIGPAAEIESAYRMRSLLEVDIPVAGVAILLFTIALCLVVNWPDQDRLRMRWLIAFLAISAALTLFLTFAPTGGFTLLLVGALAAGNLLLGLSAGRYAVLDTGGRGRWPYWISGGFAALILVAGLAVRVLRPDIPLAPFRVALLGSHVAAILLLVASVLTLLRGVALNEGQRWLERSVLIVCLTTFAVDRLGNFFEVYAPFNPDWPISLFWSPLAGPLLGIAIVLSLARQAGEARREVAHSNEILAARLIEQDAALSRSYEAQKQMLQRQVMLEERQRIVRDMHDGIGGQLLGLMMQVRSGGVAKDEVEQGLQSSIADLRLIVDSMDSAEDGLAETLRSFEHRARPQLEATGIALEFRQQIDEGINLGPRPTLQVLRILQEAVTNAMRHSGASRVQVHSRHGSDGQIEISICDNGSGLPASLRRGRGLTSMETRARNLGGRLLIQSAGEGTTLSLAIPPEHAIPRYA